MACEKKELVEQKEDVKKLLYQNMDALLESCKEQFELKLEPDDGADVINLPYGDMENKIELLARNVNFMARSGSGKKSMDYLRQIYKYILPVAQGDEVVEQEFHQNLNVNFADSAIRAILEIVKVSPNNINYLMDSFFEIIHNMNSRYIHSQGWCEYADNAQAYGKEPFILLKKMLDCFMQIAKEHNKLDYITQIAKIDFQEGEIGKINPDAPSCNMHNKLQKILFSKTTLFMLNDVFKHVNEMCKEPGREEDPCWIYLDLQNIIGEYVGYDNIEEYITGNNDDVFFHDLSGSIVGPECD